jgi:hypothetical protein
LNYDLLQQIALWKPWAEVGTLELQLGRFGPIAVPYSYRRLEAIVAAGFGNYYRMFEPLVGIVVEKAAGIVVDKEVVGIVAAVKETADPHSGIPV